MTETQPVSLRDQLARSIREAVRLSYGPNAREILAKGGALHLNSGEADTAADAALAAIKDAGYRLCRDITPEGEAEDARSWS